MISNYEQFLVINEGIFSKVKNYFSPEARKARGKKKVAREVERHNVHKDSVNKSGVLRSKEARQAEIKRSKQRVEKLANKHGVKLKQKRRR